MSQHSLFGSSGGPEDRTLYYGDCLDRMSLWKDETVDLIYLDPPDPHTGRVLDQGDMFG